MVGLWQKVAGKAPQTGKTWIALSILAAVVVVGSLGLVPIELIAVTGAVLTVVIGALTPRSAVRALNWNILAVIAGSVGLGRSSWKAVSEPTSQAQSWLCRAGAPHW